MLKEGNEYRMWFNGGHDAGFRVGYATSPDGVVWTKYAGNPVLTAGPAGSWDEYHAGEPHLVYEQGLYKLWYMGKRFGDWLTTPEDMGYATSTDGITWTKHPGNPVMRADPNSWEWPSVTNGHVLREAGQYHMWYTAGPWPKEIGYATSSDGVVWSKYAGNPVLSTASPSGWLQPVVRFAAGSANSVLDGFTVRNGDAEAGTGITIEATPVTVRDCITR